MMKSHLGLMTKHISKDPLPPPSLSLSLTSPSSLSTPLIPSPSVSQALSHPTPLSVDEMIGSDRKRRRNPLHSPQRTDIREESKEDTINVVDNEIEKGEEGERKEGDDGERAEDTIPLKRLKVDRKAEKLDQVGVEEEISFSKSDSSKESQASIDPPSTSIRRSQRLRK